MQMHAQQQLLGGPGIDVEAILGGSQALAPTVLESSRIYCYASSINFADPNSSIVTSGPSCTRTKEKAMSQNPFGTTPMLAVMHL